ncbi:MAG: hypothetical protein ACMUIS_07190 [bacterium]
MAGMKSKTNFNHYLDMITRNDSLSFQIVGETFDYSCLGTRKQYNIDLNFKTLVSDIGGFLPHAIKNRGVRSVESNVMKGLRYSSMQEYEQEKLWLVQLANNASGQ